MSAPSPFTFFSPIRIEFGFGKAKTVGEEALNMGLKRICVVSDNGLRAAGLLDHIMELLNARGLACISYTDIETDPDIDCVKQGVAVFSENGCDGLVALGGGSPIDVAKAIGVVVAGGFPVEEYGMDRRPVEKPIPPLITVPTTAGTGSEVSRGAIITNREEKIKMAVRAPVNKAHLTTPRLCILDPEFTFSLSRRMTIATGLDALSHGLETLVSRNAHPVSRALCTEVVRLVFGFLERAASNGEDGEARAGMLQASTLAGLSLAAGLGAAHAMGHALGVHYHLHHGLAVGAVLPGVMMFNLPYCEIQYARAYRSLRSSPTEGSTHDEALGLVKLVVGLMQSLQVPSLSEMNPHTDIDVVVSATFQEKFLLGTNPAELTELEMANILSTPYKDVCIGAII